MTTHEDLSDRPLSDLVSDIVDHAGDLLRNEVSLARAEVADKAAIMARGVAFLVVGGTISAAALVMMLIAVASWLTERGLEPPVAYLATGVGALVVAIVAIVIGVRRFSAERLTPRATLDQMRRDRVVLSELAR